MNTKCKDFTGKEIKYHIKGDTLVIDEDYKAGMITIEYEYVATQPNRAERRRNEKWMIK